MSERAIEKIRAVTDRPVTHVAVVTGASGFLGRAFAHTLKARGWEVRGVDVRPGPHVTVGDVSRAGAWTRVLEGADVVIHAAEIVGEAGDPAMFWRVNVEGTRTVLEAAGHAAVGRVLHLSSKVVFGTDFPDGVDESGPVKMTGNPYTDTAVAAEHQALLAHAGGLATVTIVRLGDVYGPHAAQWTVRPVELMRRNLFVLVEAASGGLGKFEQPGGIGGAAILVPRNRSYDDIQFLAQNIFLIGLAEKESSTVFVVNATTFSGLADTFSRTYTGFGLITAKAATLKNATIGETVMIDLSAGQAADTLNLVGSYARARGTITLDQWEAQTGDQTLRQLIADRQPATASNTNAKVNANRKTTGPIGIILILGQDQPKNRTTATIPYFQRAAKISSQTVAAATP